MTKDTNIPQGYKDSPLGIIPKDWEVKKISDFAPLQRGFDLPADKITAGAYPVVYSNGVLNYHIEYKAKGPGVVTGRSGTIGKVTYVESDFWPHNTSLWVTDFKGNNPKFVFYVYKYIGLSKFASGSGVPTLNRNDVHVSKVAVPPIEEQRQIIRVLELWDTAIEEQSKLIEKLNLRKRALMQQLLTGKKRLPGFSDEWKTKQIQEHFKLVLDKNDGKAHLPMTISAKYGLVSQKNKFDRVIAGNSLNRYTLLQKGDFAYNKGNSNLYEMGCIYRLKEKSAVVPFVYICFRIKDHTCGDFYSHFFANHGLDSQLKRIITSGARGDGLLNVYTKDFMLLKIPYPNIEEQKVIADVLNDGDKEIELAKEKLANLQSQKRGLMQQLLTGKKRVKS